MRSDYLTTEEAAAFLKCKSAEAFRAMLRRRRKAGFPITTYRLNGRMRFRQADLEAALTVQRARRLRVVGE